ncbi:MAG: hypothetical protein EON54_19760 [Alcaligenaceae bacterium]|nr:MAG: hypothetical protein EON54_19760 [Alcaligenaceae bacterium]
MKSLLKSTLLVALTAAATFVATATYYNHRVSKQVYAGFVAQAVQMEAFNDIGRLEAYDRVEDFLHRGCVKEALGLVQVQQRLVLNGIAYRMEQGGEEVRKVVLSRSGPVADRARAESAKRWAIEEPKCR